MATQWLLPTWLSWPVAAERILVSPLHSDYRPYVLLEHADSILSQESQTREARADALMNLRRAIDQRIRSLVQRYKLKLVPIKEKPSGDLALLEFFGLVRPVMAQQLIELRNAVEHEDAEPPPIEKLREFSDFIWYLLRSTDLRIRPKGALNFDSPFLENEPRNAMTAPPYRIVVDISPDSDVPWEVSIQGYVARIALSDTPRDGYVVLEVTAIESRSEREASPNRFWWERYAQVAGQDDVFIHGKMRGASKHFRALVQRYVLFS